METTKKRAGGLEGVVVADTALSDVDGVRGRLTIAGHDVERLAGSVCFEQALGLLFSGEVPAGAGLEALRDALAEGRRLGFESLAERDLAFFADGMDALRASVAALPPAGFEPLEAARPIGAIATFAAAWSRVRRGLSPVPPDLRLGHAADYLRMLDGEPPRPERTRALDAYLVTVADHGMNASTFTARVVASTGSDLVSALTAAIGALKGPLHGGAPGPVLDMLDAIGAPSGAEAWLEEELRAGRRVMGMGHRIYRVRDPRAAVLERAIEALERSGAKGSRLALARAVEAAAEGALRRRHPDRPLHANVEFYTAVLLDTLGIPRTLFSPTFAVGRAAGWAAHVREQRATGRIIRPASRYVGAIPPEASRAQ